MASSFARTAFAVITAASIAGSAANPVHAAATDAGLPVFKSITVELPSGDRQFPQGPGVDVISANCVACHSPGMILNQPSLSKAAWEGEVKKMIGVYKAPVDAADVPAIVEYLTATKGS